ncbi:hypothetical protein BKA62DRAFT_709508 [Auriculariales sp. MPI-PUGE-AT-0066]|nr:hypothetical protein BKA62DRAFT_709508 [Auriculariales sp. MPI-PUGE-AT-0066]
MSTYYTPTQRRGRTPIYPSSPLPSRSRSPLYTTDLTPSASILIFPSPSNAVEPSVPDSPYASSISSLPTEISFATDDRFAPSRRSTSRCSDRSPSRSRCSSVLARDRLTSTSWEDLGDELRHASHAPGSYLSVPLLGATALYAAGASTTMHDEPTRWLTLNPRPRRESTVSYFSDYQEPPQPEEQAREQLPLLSVLRKVFAIDEDTIDVLTRPSSQRTELFDASPYAPGEHPGTAPDSTASWTPGRGMSLTNDFEQPARGLKRGFAARAAVEWDDHPFSLRTSLWTLVSIAADAVRAKGKTSGWSTRPWQTRDS